MNQICNFNQNTREYLKQYHLILKRMIRGMTCAKLTGSISHNFIVQMIPHHRAAIEMSRNLLRYHVNAPLRRIAQNIISSQTRSIQNMLAIKTTCSACCNSQRDVQLYQCRVNQIIRTMFAEMSRAEETNRIDVDFIREMIPHHRGAIEMSQNALQQQICPELRPILNAIIVSQSKGIREMEQLLACMERATSRCC